jgi:G3E family GTPase
MSKTPLYLITGFLGSGKTTFIRQAIGHFEGKQKIAIVQNEFAPASYDGKDLKRTTNANFDLLEINNGSVFCVCLLSGFIDSLFSFVDTYKPDILLMEASGLSDPVSIGQIFNSAKLQESIYLAGTICIADANNFSKFDKLLPRIHHQLQIADVILINKTDLIINAGEISQKISQINPFAQKYLTQHCHVPLENIFSNSLGTQKKLFFIPGNSDRPDVQSVVFRSTKPIKQLHVEDFLNQLTAQSIRIKGLLLLDINKILSVQAIADEIHTEIIPVASKQTELIVMGYQIDMQFIHNQYQSFL